MNLEMSRIRKKRNREDHRRIVRGVSMRHLLTRILVTENLKELYR